MRSGLRLCRPRFTLLFAVLAVALLSMACHSAAAQREIAASRGDFSASHSTSSAAKPDSGVILDRMLLLLKPSGAQRQALDAELMAQVTPGSTEFHRWLTPTGFAERFALSAADTVRVADWLRDRGFTVAALPAGRGWIEFSGSVGQVEDAFAVPVVPMDEAEPGNRPSPDRPNRAEQDFSASASRYRLAGTVKLPPAIAPLVVGLVSLDGTLASAASVPPAEFDPTDGAANTRALTPDGAAALLHLPAFQTGAAGGAGETIVIPSRSRVRQADFDAFRESVGLPEAALKVQATGGGMIDGLRSESEPWPEPASGREDDEAAATLAASWAGVAAPEATILIATARTTNSTDGIDLALAAAIDGALGHTVSVGYASCESVMSAAHRAFYASLYRQAAAQGIAVVAATGDSGAAGCRRAGSPAPAAAGWGVNALASTPWDTAVGAAELSQDNPAPAAAFFPWEPGSAAEPAYATGGGPSLIYSEPIWQAAAGISPGKLAIGGSSVAGNPRFLPDLSLPGAMARGGGLEFCLAGEPGSALCRRVIGGGSAASAAIFAGIAALLAQQYGPQGNLAPNLYALARAEATQGTPVKSAALVDIASGGARLPCAVGTAHCSEDGVIGFEATAGYDLASGLGSVNVQTLLQDWPVPQATGTAPVTVEMTNAAGITYNPSAIIVLSARVLSGSGGTVPTGTVQFYDQTLTANAGPPVTLDAQGDASYSEDGQFTVGGHNIEAIYSGDSTYESAKSQPVTINVQPSPTSLTVTPSTTTPAGGSTFTVTGVVTSTNPGNTPPSGTLTVNLDGLPQGNTTLSTTAGVTSGSVSVTAPAAGSHTVQGVYSGDVNYNNATSPSVTITISKVASATTVSATPATLTPGVPETLTATVAPLTPVTGTVYTLTGTVSFYDGGATLLGTATVSANTATLAGVALSAAAAHTITAVYSGDATYGASTSAALILQPVLLPVTVVLTGNNTLLTPGQTANLTATVIPVGTPASTAEQHATGTVSFYAGATLIASVSLIAGAGDTATASTPVPALPAGSYSLTAVYSGDLTYGGATSNSLTLQVEDFTVQCSPNSVSVVQGESVSLTVCTVGSLGGLSGPIQLACAEQDPPQVGALGCYFTPTPPIQSNGSTQLTVTTTAGVVAQSSARNQPDSPARNTPLWPAGGAALAVALLWPKGQSSRRRNRRASWTNWTSSTSRTSWMRLSGLALLLVALGGSGVGCNGSGETQTRGTPLGVHTVKITAAADVDTVTVSHYAYVTVNVTLPSQ